MARKKEKTDKHGYVAEHYQLISVKSHLSGDQIVGTYGLFRTPDSISNGETPIETVPVRIPIGALDAVPTEVRAALDAAISGPGGALEGSTFEAD